MIKLAPGNYTGGFVVEGKSVSVFGSGAALNTTSTSQTFHVLNDGQLRLVGLKMTNLNGGANGIAVACERLSGTTTPVADLEGVEIEANQPIIANPCTMTVRGSRIKGVAGHNVFMASGINAPATVTIQRTIFDRGEGFAIFPYAVVQVSNSIIANQSSASSNVGAIESSGKFYVSFSTVINSPIKCSTAMNSFPTCYPGGSGLGSCFDNSVIFNADASAPADTVVGNCAASYTMVYPQTTALVGANNRLGVNPMFADVLGNDFHLSSQSPAIDAADPAASNDVDYEGKARPQGQRADLGAYEYGP